MEEADSSETLITLHQTTLRHMPERSVYITVEISNLTFFGQIYFCKSRFPVQFFFLPTLKAYLLCPEECIEGICSVYLKIKRGLENILCCLLKNQERI